MSYLRYEPWTFNRALLGEMNRFFDRAVADDATSAAVAEWAPRVDIAEFADRFVLTADVPGVDPSAVEITLEKGVLTLSGSREKPAEQAGVQLSRVERESGRFSRRFALPDTVDGESVSAHGKHGVLEIVIPKRPAEQPRRITVKH